jgi:protocatechuate 3,4-dioxygenase alpha subunit
MGLPRTPSQTIGPFFAVAIPRRGEERAVPADTPGAFWLRGRVTDGAGEPVPDGLVETWQAADDSVLPAGRGLGRAATDAEGQFAIFTTKPGAVAGPTSDPQAPHLEMVVFARGLLRHLVTRVYFADEVEANASDPVLQAIADPAARATLIAAKLDDGYRFDIRLQGDGETVFFEP